MSFQVIKTWKQSSDPAFEAKKNRILHLYGLMDGTDDVLDGDQEVVICVDEFGPLNLNPIPAGNGRPAVAVGRDLAAGGGPPSPAPMGSGTCWPPTTFPATGCTGTSSPESAVEFLVFCRYLRTLYPPGVRLGIVLDNFSPHLSTRTDRRVANWAAANNVELAYVPTNASWLNRIEAQFTALRYFALDGTDHTSHAEQASMIRRYIAWRNRNAHDRRFREIVDRANAA